ncbi:hypothetical protein VTN31DRAFT_1328 [Thermomyces dupontii]|uniref:uncharacterized protein n=1 Tax=Talaromyces thermophilus TaxID=28565 RepID=UPI0037443EC8
MFRPIRAFSVLTNALKVRLAQARPACLHTLHFANCRSQSEREMTLYDCVHHSPSTRMSNLQGNSRILNKQTRLSAQSQKKTRTPIPQFRLPHKAPPVAVLAEVQQRGRRTGSEDPRAKPMYSVSTRAYISTDPGQRPPVTEV